MRKTGLGLALAVLCAANVRADGAADLRAALAKLTARDTIRANVTLETRNKSDEDEPVQGGQATIEVEHGPQGLRLTYASDVVTRAQNETRAYEADPEKPRPTFTALRSIDAAALMESLDAASVLLAQLDQATLQKEQRVNQNGRVLRQLTFVVKPKLSKRQSKHVKSVDISLVVTVDDAGVPVSADQKQKLKAKFLLMSFEQESHETWSLARVGDRLVGLRRHETASGKGMGQKFNNATTTTLTVK